MRTKGETFKYALYSCLIAAVITGVSALTGEIVFGGDRPKWIACICVVCGVLLLWAAVSLADQMRVRAKYSEKDPRLLYERNVRLKRKVESDYRRAERAARVSLSWSNFSLVLLLALLLFLALCIGALRTFYAAIPCAVIGIVVAEGIYILFLPRGTSPADGITLVPVDAYPLFYEMARRAAIKVGCPPPRIGRAEGTTCVVEDEISPVLALGAVECALLTRDELYAVFLHEFAHVRNVDTERSLVFYRGRRRWDLRRKNPLYRFVGLFTFAFAQRFLIGADIYETIATRHHEELADEKVRKLRKGQDLVNALAKLKMFDLFNRVPRRELCYDRFCEEKPTGVKSLEVAVFRKYKETEAPFWREIILRELSPLVSSHPSVRSRMEAMGADSFDDTKEETDPEYFAEARKFMKNTDEAIARSIAWQYAEMRRTKYIKRKALMEKYEQAKEQGTDLSADDLIDCMAAFYGVDGEKTLEIADALLARDARYAYAHLFRARVLSDRMDAGCVEAFYAAMRENYNLCETCLNELGEYILLSGDQALLDKYRESMPEMAKEAMREEEASDWKRGMPLRACALPEQTLRELGKSIREICEDALERLYAADFGEGVTAVFLRFRPRTPAAVKAELTSDVCSWLDACPDSFCVRLCRGPQLRALKRAGIEPLADTE